MNPNCRTFQSLWLERADARSTGSAEGLDAHLASCEPCGAWVRRTEATQAALGGLERLSAPAALEERLFGSQETDQPEPELDVTDLPQGVRLLQSLSRLPAPTVLERLVDEELAQPAQARVRRFVGDLERPETPSTLEHRVEERLPRSTRFGSAASLERRPSLLRRLAPLTSLVAAGLLFVAMLDQSEPEEPRRRLVVHHVSSAAELDPMARGMLDASLGGLLQAMPPQAAQPEEGR